MSQDFWSNIDDDIETIDLSAEEEYVSYEFNEETGDWVGTAATEEDRRSARKERRRQNQKKVYMSVLVVLAVTVGIVGMVSFTAGTGAKQVALEQSQQQEKVDAILASEEILEEPVTLPTETVAELTDAQKLDEIVNAGIEVMPLEDKVAGLFIVTPEALTGVTTAVKAGEGTQTALGQYAVGGVIYFSKNIQSESQLKEMIDNTKLYSKYPLFIAVDEEGGSVSRVAYAGLAEKSPEAQEVARTGDANKAYEVGSNIGTYLSNLGFNLNFAPVADLNNVDESVLGGRSYGATAAVASPFVTSMMRGLEDKNVTACLKHFPGIGSTTQDTHNGIAMSERTALQFRDQEFKVFQAGIDAGANMVMVGHMSAPYLTGDNTPCSLSEAVVTDVLREEMGFEGVIISDAMNMSAISEYHTSEQAAVLALRAGCDMVLMPENFEEAYTGVLKAVQEGTISEERINDSLRRIYRIKYAERIAE